jgi:hypothetical protein
MKSNVSQEMMGYMIQIQPFLILNGKRRMSLGGLALGPWSAIDPRMNKEVELLSQPDTILSPVCVNVGQTDFVSVSASSSSSIGCTSTGDVWESGAQGDLASPRSIEGGQAEEIKNQGGAIKAAAGLEISIALVEWCAQPLTMREASRCRTSQKSARREQSMEHVSGFRTDHMEVSAKEGARSIFQGGVASISCGLSSLAAVSGESCGCGVLFLGEDQGDA